ncbi:MAG TPA: Rieske 2Fe-2S domain-containing protein [Ideonella sp.]|nr:Rieske 2Fe-2S domain-containing protein [Ideonella sp.]
MNASETVLKIDPAAAETAAETGKFDWRNCWYPVAFCADLPPGQPLAFTLHDEPFVLFRDRQGRICCVEDRCPHRMASLSSGRVVDGVLECGYHGWQFDGDGACVRIPQLAPEQPKPARACVPSRAATELQGIVWMWAGEPHAARLADIPIIGPLDDPAVTRVDYVTDLPYDQSYLVENVIDVAHIHIAHDGVRGGGHRHLALPLEFDVLEESVHGIKAEYRSIAPERDPSRSPLASAGLEFRAPGLVHYTSNYRNRKRIAGLALYSLPLGRGRCRLLYRKYSNFYSWREAWKPRWLEHWTQNTILRQDMDLIIGQYAAIERSGKELRDLWLPLKSCDQLVIRYRKWLDRNAPPTGPYRGFSTHASPPEAPSAAATPSTFTLHTRQCETCRRSYRAARRARGVLVAAMALLLPVVMLASTGGARAAALGFYAAALAAVAACRAFERRFE